MFYLLLLAFINIISTEHLFAGNGLRTYAHNIFRNRILEMNCTTYSDCYSLLCNYIYQPMYYITIVPNYWNGDCRSLNMNDDKLFIAQFDVYTRTGYNKTVSTKTISDASKFLCMMSNNSYIRDIYYNGENC